jgi:hypothetical protein
LRFLFSVEGIERVSAFTANSSTLPNILFTSESLRELAHRLVSPKNPITLALMICGISPIRFASMTYPGKYTLSLISFFPSLTVTTFPSEQELEKHSHHL